MKPRPESRGFETIFEQVSQIFPDQLAQFAVDFLWNGTAFYLRPGDRWKNRRYRRAFMLTDQAEGSLDNEFGQITPPSLAEKY
jgi:hypothetical protein